MSLKNVIKEILAEEVDVDERLEEATEVDFGVPVPVTSKLMGNGGGMLLSNFVKTMNGISKEIGYPVAITGDVIIEQLKDTKMLIRIEGTARIVATQTSDLSSDERRSVRLELEDWIKHYNWR